MSGRAEGSRVLVGTLYRGESQFEACRRSLRRQSHPRVDHRVVEDLANREAHETLYRDFMEASNDYDVFVKLDADMVLRRPEALAEVVRYFRERPGLDHAIFAVHDWLSGELIEGLHVFTGRARWTFSEEELFVDPGPRVPGRSVSVWEEPAPLVDHAPDPTSFEAFRFGVHRGLKLRQPGRPRLRFGQFLLQRRVLAGCWNRFAVSEDRRRALAVLGAELVLCGEIRGDDYGGEEEALRRRFEVEAELDSERLRARLAPRWKGRVRRLAHQARAAGPGRLAVGAARMAAYRTLEAWRECKQRVERTVDGPRGTGAA